MRIDGVRIAGVLVQEGLSELTAVRHIPPADPATSVWQILRATELIGDTTAAEWIGVELCELSAGVRCPGGRARVQLTFISFAMTSPEMLLSVTLRKHREQNMLALGTKS